MKTLSYSLFVLLLSSFVTVSAEGSSYEVEDIPSPPSRYGSSEFDGLAFMPNGKLVVTLASGEVFLYDSGQKKWSLFVEGLHNPLGVVALSDKSIIVAQRPEITRITDTDGDGRGDFFENLTDDFGLSGNYSEFSFTPIKAKNGDLFFSLATASNGAGIRRISRGAFDLRGRPGRMYSCVPYRGWVMKLTQEGKLIPWSSGHRMPNGLGFDAEERLYVSDNQGDWVGSSKLFHVRKDHFFGHVSSRIWEKDYPYSPDELSAEQHYKDRSRAAVVFPHGGMARSPTQPLCDTTAGKFGPFQNQMLIGEMNPITGDKPVDDWGQRHGEGGSGRLMRLMLEEVDGQMQGACIPFLDGQGLHAGVNRLAFAEDGSLWIGHTQHTWIGGRGLQRIVYKGEKPMDVLKMNITSQGFKLTFTKPVDKSMAQKKETFKFNRFWVRYHSTYGSKLYDEEDVKIKKISVSEDGLTVDVELDELRCYFIHELKINGLKAADGSELRNSYMAYTVNRLLENTPPEPIQYEVKNSKN